MRASADPVLVKRLSVFASVASVFSVAIGLSGLSGWVFHLLRLTTWGFAPVKMVANTAAGFVLLGGSLWLLRRRTSQPFSRIQNAAAKALAVIAGVLGLLSLAEHLFTVNLGIDQILVRVPATDHAAGVSPGLMSSLTALDFFLLGCAILLLDRRTRRDDWPAQFLCTSEQPSPPRLDWLPCFWSRVRLPPAWRGQRRLRSRSLSLDCCVLGQTGPLADFLPAAAGELDYCGSQLLQLCWS